MESMVVLLNPTLTQKNQVEKSRAHREMGPIKKAALVYAVVIGFAVIAVLIAFTHTGTKNITITSPLVGAAISLPFTIQGQARVFESTLAVRIKNASGTILFLAQGVMAKSPDAGQFGLWSVLVDHLAIQPKEKGIVLEAYSFSAKDGSEINLVSVAVQLAPSSQY